MEKIKVNPIIKENLKWTIENIPSVSLQEVRDKYFNKIVTDGEDDLHVTEMRFIPTGINSRHYVVDLIDSDNEASHFLKI